MAISSLFFKKLTTTWTFYKQFSREYYICFDHLFGILGKNQFSESSLLEKPNEKNDIISDKIYPNYISQDRSILNLRNSIGVGYKKKPLWLPF